LSILKRIFRHIILTCFLIGGIACYGQNNPLQEYQVKAIFLFNFSQFTEWPAAAFDSPTAPIIIGILGKNPFGTFLNETIVGEKVNGRPLILKYYKEGEDIDKCHILYINLSESEHINQILNTLKGKNVLTISDSESFIFQGGMIRFLTLKNKIRLQINPEEAKKDQLIISVKVLKLAEIIVPNKKR
jgi:hypothetical protein